MPIPNTMIDWEKTYKEFASGEDKTCPNCHKEVDFIVMYEKSEPGLYALYVMNCECRLGLWHKAPQWAVEADMVVTHAFEDY